MPDESKMSTSFSADIQDASNQSGKLTVTTEPGNDLISLKLESRATTGTVRMRPADLIRLSYHIALDFPKEVPEEVEDDDELMFECDICGQEKGEDEVDEKWIALFKPDAFEVLVCTECSGSKENLEKAFELFLEKMAAVKREEMT
jgi:hypothetical protein